MRRSNLNPSRYWLLKENQAFAAQIPVGAKVLDAGAGEAPYRNLFSHTQYETADFEKVNKRYTPSTYVCDLAQIPVEDARFDFIVFNQVMEHLPEPKVVLLELNRVLKSGGKMIYTAPLFYEEHEKPYDFYRYTQYGIKHLMECAGFTIERLDWLEGYFATVGYQLNRMARYLPHHPHHLAPGIKGYILTPLVIVLKWVFSISSALFNNMDKKVKFKGKGYPKNYVAIVTKSSDKLMQAAL